MEFWDVLILGVIQGLTEFLPISSSGHLVISQHMLGIKAPGVSLEIWLHFGTLVAVLVYYYKRLFGIVKALLGHSENRDENLRLLLAIIVGTIPAVIVGFSLKSSIESAFGSTAFTSAMLVVTGMILLASGLARNKNLQINIPRGFAIGIAQALAILPGISRSGSTITYAMLLGIKPAKAAEFSFLLAIPAIGGAFLLDLLSSDNMAWSGSEIGLYLIGALVSFVFGLLSIHYLLKLIARGKFFIFGFYCLAAGIISFIFVN
ncbi:MAG: undecaprenyl-diphosphatase UppP [candidate division Zixibacteria bacterium]